jgi:hypothetical protein
VGDDLLAVKLLEIGIQDVLVGELVRCRCRHLQNVSEKAGVPLRFQRQDLPQILWGGLKFRGHIMAIREFKIRAE